MIWEVEETHQVIFFSSDLHCGPPLDHSPPLLFYFPTSWASFPPLVRSPVSYFPVGHIDEHYSLPSYFPLLSSYTDSMLNVLGVHLYRCVCMYI